MAHVWLISQRVPTLHESKARKFNFLSPIYSLSVEKATSVVAIFFAAIISFSRKRKMPRVKAWLERRKRETNDNSPEVTQVRCFLASSLGASIPRAASPTGERTTGEANRPRNPRPAVITWSGDRRSNSAGRSPWVPGSGA
jgi:hypothetical protein